MDERFVAAMTARDNAVSSFAINQVRAAGASGEKAAADLDRRISALRAGLKRSTRQ